MAVTSQSLWPLYAFVCLYMLVLAVIATFAQRWRRSTASEHGELAAYFGGSFRAPLLALTTFSTVYSGFTVTGVPEEAYHKGYISLRWIGATLAIVTSMLLLYPRLRRLAVARNYRSPNDFLIDRYRTGRLCILAIICGYVPMIIYLTAQMLSFGATVEGLTMETVPRWASMLVFCIVILSMEKVGGMHSVVLTDAVQSTIMIASFLAVPFVLGVDFGFLPNIAPADCSSITYVFPNSTDGDGLPRTCDTKRVDVGCRVSGCIQDVRPEFFEYPDRVEQANMFFFLLNMVAAPLQPHMLQRAYIANSDRSLRIVMVVMLVAPFLAQTPGIIMGLTKAAFEPSWSDSSQQATAFASISDQLVTRGPFQYLLAIVMTGSAMSAIMSTADSAILGASSIISIDGYKGLFDPSATTNKVVRVAECNSLVMTATAFAFALNMSVDNMASMIIFQNGMLMQLIPAYGVGLFIGISERAVTGGIVAGFFSLLILVMIGNPVASYVPSVNVSVFVNFIVVFVSHLCIPRPSFAIRGSVTEVVSAQARFGAPLCPAAIAEVMSTSTEPNRALLSLMIVALILSIPWYGQSDEAAAIWAGLPVWGSVQVLAYVGVLLMGFAAVWSWRTARACKGDDGQVKEHPPAEVCELPTILQAPSCKLSTADADKLDPSQNDEPCEDTQSV